MIWLLYALNMVLRNSCPGLPVGRKFKDATKAGAGATIGLFAGALGKLGCCAAMMLAFTVNVIYRSVNH